MSDDTAELRDAIARRAHTAERCPCRTLEPHEHNYAIADAVIALLRSQRDLALRTLGGESMTERDPADERVTVDLPRSYVECRDGWGGLRWSRCVHPGESVWTFSTQEE